MLKDSTTSWTVINLVALPKEKHIIWRICQPHNSLSHSSVCVLRLYKWLRCLVCGQRHYIWIWRGTCSATAPCCSICFCYSHGTCSHRKSELACLYWSGIYLKLCDTCKNIFHSVWIRRKLNTAPRNLLLSKPPIQPVILVPKSNV